MTDSFWLKFIQPERRLHSHETIAEMLMISALMYGVLACGGIIAMTLPLWPGMDKPVIYTVCLSAIVMGALFFVLRERIPTWLAVMHIPIGICMITLIVEAAYAPQSVAIAVAYVVGSTYIFHYYTRQSAFGLLSIALVGLSWAMISNDIQGWQGTVFFVAVCMLVNGEVARITAERINQMATRDKLTGLLNRETIESIITGKLLSNQIPFSIVLFDLNAFKAVNDNHGHLMGDEVLRQVARAMKANTPMGAGYAARWGGDEFIVLLQGNSYGHEEDIATSIRRDLTGIIGFECGISQARLHDSLDELIHRADTGMYKNKRNRRATDVAVA